MNETAANSDHSSTSSSKTMTPERLKIARMASNGKRAFRESHSKWALMHLVSEWGKVSDPEERVAIGNQVFRLFEAGEDYYDPDLVEAILAFVGTDVCQCKSDEAWSVVERFIQADRVIGVRFAAMLAGARLIQAERLPDDPKRFIASVKALSESNLGRVKSNAVHILRSLESH